MILPINTTASLDNVSLNTTVGLGDISLNTTISSDNVSLNTTASSDIISLNTTALEGATARKALGDFIHVFRTMVFEANLKKEEPV